MAAREAQEVILGFVREMNELSFGQNQRPAQIRVLDIRGERFELSTMNQLSTSKTLMVHKNAIDGRPEQPGLPMMLKVPDASFSRGVIKVKDLGHLKCGVRQLFRDTDLVLVQRAVCMMGDGLYGVDIKQAAQGLKVIEVNDNPSIDAGVEDRVHG